MSGDMESPTTDLRAGSDPAESNHRWRFNGVMDLIIALAIVGSIVYVPLIASQNRQLRTQVVNAAVTEWRAQTLDLTLQRNIQLSTLEGRSMPEPLARKIRMALGPRLARMDRGLLLVAYTPMVCERTLNDGLRSLQSSRALKASGLSLYAMVGERSQGDRERALLLRADGLLAFPMTFLPADSLLAALAPRADSAFDEEPLYMRLDRHLTILSVFHADQWRPALLDAWLETTTQ